ncbi:hypothetical protein [Selenomonas ruminantium]|uniref:Uncharacterized protein n=1 Tax=Selenomonas ruminantium TaxID=971 RepID=A0A1H0M7L5_SELRU|nr:hypothetical protein [Selenomonas ruminantium]SDO76394.1 hypothetical protein SAMN05216366_10155 [Selenomonas ruminantium]
MADDKKNNQKAISKDDLWAKAAGDSAITRKDLGITKAGDKSGMQALNEGYSIDIGDLLNLGDQDNTK